MAAVSHIPYFSNILNRIIDVEVTGHWGHPILMFPFSYGSYTQNRDFGLNDTVMHFVEQGKIKLYNIETLDGWSFYAEHMSSEEKIAHYKQYLRFMVEELIPRIQQDCQTHRVAVAGCSFGGYHAGNIAFRFPDLVSHLFSMSGVFNIRNLAPLSDDIRIYFNCPDEFVLNDESWKYQHMHIVLNTSNWDICLSRNQRMHEVLNTKGIAHWYDERQLMEHDWPLWKMVFPEYIQRYFN